MNATFAPSPERAGLSLASIATMTEADLASVEESIAARRSELASNAEIVAAAERAARPKVHSIAHDQYKRIR